VVNEWNILDEEIISGCSLVGFKRKLDRHLRDKRGYISALAFFPLYRQLDDLDPRTHQVQVQVQDPSKKVVFWTSNQKGSDSHFKT